MYKTNIRSSVQPFISFWSYFQTIRLVWLWNHHLQPSFIPKREKKIILLKLQRKDPIILFVYHLEGNWYRHLTSIYDTDRLTIFLIFTRFRSKPCSLPLNANEWPRGKQTWSTHETISSHFSSFCWKVITTFTHHSYITIIQYICYDDLGTQTHLEK